MKDNTIVIGLGHKARSGKDYIAEFLHDKIPNSKIIHWADSLYEEVENKDRKYPLIRTQQSNTGAIYALYDYHKMGQPVYYIVHEKEVPNLHRIMQERRIATFMGADYKDSLMLQFWGTDFRRKFCGDNYWVTRLNHKIERLIATNNSDSPLVIFIPDTRFVNEYDHIKWHNGQYWEVQRFNEDGSRYLDPSRDPNHPSEINMDEMIEQGRYDLLLKATSGDTKKLEEDAMTAINNILVRQKEAA